MIGHIESYDEDTQTGVIKNEQGYFEFHKNDWSEEEGPYVGDDVLFEGKDGEATLVTLIGNYLQHLEPIKSRTKAALLGFFLGGLGAHRFYLGFYRIAIVQIIVTALTLGFGVIWGFIEAVLIFGGHIDKDAKGHPLK